MKMLVGCSLPDAALRELQSLSTDLVYEPTITPQQLEKAIRSIAVLVVAGTRVAPEVIAAGKSLQMIVRTGTDTANIAISDASAQGVFVCNCPDRDAAAVAELTIGLLLALDRRLLERVEAPPAAEVRSLEQLEAWGMNGRTLGILGWGPVGEQIASRMRSFGPKLVAWRPARQPEAPMPADIEVCTWPRELARRSDMVAVFARRQDTEEVRVDADFVANLRDGTYLVYVGAPVSLDEDALARLAAEKHLRVAYDLYDPQLTPSTAERVRARLAKIPGVIGSQHLAGQTRHTYEMIAAETVRVIRRFLVAGEVVNCVNLVEHSPATWQLVLRLQDTVGILASIMEHIRADGINAQEVTSRVFTGARAASCVIALDERPSTEALEAIRTIDGVLHLELRALM